MYLDCVYEGIKGTRNNHRTSFLSLRLLFTNSLVVCSQLLVI